MGQQFTLGAGPAQIMGQRVLPRCMAVAAYAFYGRQPSFSGCCRQDLERTAGQSRLHNVVTVLLAPSEDISVPAIFLVALQ